MVRFVVSPFLSAAADHHTATTTTATAISLSQKQCTRAFLFVSLARFGHCFDTVFDAGARPLVRVISVIAQCMSCDVSALHSLPSRVPRASHLSFMMQGLEARRRCRLRPGGGIGGRSCQGDIQDHSDVGPEAAIQDVSRAIYLQRAAFPRVLPSLSSSRAIRE